MPRLSYIDTAKGISIVMVAFAHSPLRFAYPEANEFMRLFRLPVFFFLSGVFLNVNVEWAGYLRKKADVLLKPFFTIQLLMLLIAIVFSDPRSVGAIVGIAYGNGATITNVPMWYLTHLWVVFFAATLLAQFTGIESSRPLAKSLLVATLLIAGAFFIDVFWKLPVAFLGYQASLPGLPFSADVVTVSLAFFLSGHFLAAQVRCFKPNTLMFVLAGATVLLVSMNTGAFIDLNHRRFNEPLAATIAAFGGIYAMLCIAYWVSQLSVLGKLIVPFGASSLFILIFHGPTSNLAFLLVNHVSRIDSQETIMAIAFIIGVVLPIILRQLVMLSPSIRLFLLPLYAFPRAQRA
ncbi:MAG: acyltransferase family protein [Gammaproteobacteria bacterium]|nr:acyltransferase family protein [Gammaproteobacteria bacterium]